MKGERKMKKIIVFFSVLIYLVFISAGICAYADYTIQYNGITEQYTGSIYKLMIDGNIVNTTVPPLIFNDYALVPIREVFEPMGADVNYIDVSKQIFVNFGDSYLRLKIGDTAATVNEIKTHIPGNIAPMLISVNSSSAKTMVPARFIAEKLGFDVNFDAANGIIKINRPPVVTKASINNYNVSSSGLNTTVKISFDKAIGDYTKPAVTNSNVLYFDVSNCTYSLNSTNEINQGAVKALRFGIHSDSTRIALDLGTYTGYKVILSNDKKTFTVTVSTLGEQTSQDPVPTPTPGQSATEKIVVIDAGHGGKDAGTHGDIDGVSYYEKDLNLKVAKKVQSILENSGIKVIMTRTSDTYPTLTERSDIANVNDAVMFVSIHSNSATSETASGFEVYYSNQNNSQTTGIASKDLANSIVSELSKNISIRNRGVKTADHVVTKTSYMPAVLVEIGFMSNKDDLSLMVTENFQNAFAQSIAAGIKNVFNKAQIPSECGIIYEEMKAAEAAAATQN